MNKPMVGMIAGAVLGAIDGGTAWFVPAVRSEMEGILMWSSVKGMLVGIICGLIARKVHSTAAGLAAGAGFGLLFAYLVAMMPEPDGTHYYLQIMVPGFVLGALIGFLTQKMGTTPVKA
jgi:asparagine N-glycosylation enzyme membrane subunit Stt3